MTGDVDAETAITRTPQVSGHRRHGPRQVRTTDEAYQWCHGVNVSAQAAARSEPPRRAIPCRRLRLRHQAQHPANTFRSRLPHDGGPRDDDGRGGARAVTRMASSCRTARATRSPATTPSQAIQEFLEAGIPIFGICLGHQLLALASGAKTVKMKFGHHGANHPVQDLANGTVAITSQNHGFAVDEDSLPDNVEATHRSLFDAVTAGHLDQGAPAFGFQGHPEASPGPHDLVSLFERFMQDMEAGSAATVRAVSS